MSISAAANEEVSNVLQTKSKGSEGKAKREENICDVLLQVWPVDTQAVVNKTET